MLAMEVYVVTLKNYSPLQKSTIDDIVDNQLKTHAAMSQGSNRVQEGSYNKSVLESRAIHDVGSVVDAKQCR